MNFKFRKPLTHAELLSSFIFFYIFFYLVHFSCCSPLSRVKKMKSWWKMGSRRKAVGSPFSHIVIQSVWRLDKDTHHLWHSWHLCASTKEGLNRICRVGVPSMLCVLQQYPPPRLYHLFPVARSPDTPQEVADKSKHIHTTNTGWHPQRQQAKDIQPQPYQFPHHPSFL